jgi:GT2 family glycosyltransferase
MNINGISVVIPNYNGLELLPITLPTVFKALDNTKLSYEVIVVDDCSTDNSVNWLKENYSSVKIVLNKNNSGFSVSCNKGVHASVYDKVLLLNSDVKLTPNYFMHQFKYFENEKTFGVMGRIIGWEDDILQDGAKYPYFHGAKIKTSGNYILADERRMKDGLYTIYLSGANAFIDKKKFLLFGGFNEIFSPFYVEDYELSLRAWRLGFVCWFDYESVCRHRVSYSIKSKAKKSSIEAIYYRNKMYLHAIHLEGYKKLIWFAQISLGAIVRLLIFQFYFIRAWFMYLFSLNKVKKSRRDFDNLSEKLNSRLSVKEVADIVLTHTKEDVIKF